ncbi:protoheme IX farnesyltransferase [Bordetella parapertussis]|uniref:Protoheme IX farnesyltransferase n=5 Tax=Bordetella TaxID=517 RepID=COXX_BORBR|nr:MULTISPECIES: heme o synthase [Bordetella]Q7W316.1 RecName: Full=Protoheme IX farnesyltransferase; AltName: Full=Heme B farnesyltransferase; AltName: Full=Heme O synthase [Bordetella parapertussis 12822]Q7WE16.1 RecName: Full=Protoheme IX farnesyltransferase; AltName: Full=Heme B farnesyltransferase; AltName: Full=Heme O synthase [Bordetella bronchiseptica RB50]KCV28481.1 protoheme IX farnesyltransferase [Bordetella bronchiseptica 00-P-2730]KDD57781.1 protoheme IX farnesyltransferase [Bordet
MSSLAAPQTGLLRQYLVLTKPRVTQLAVFCAVIGMFLAAPGMPDLSHVVFGTLGIWLLAAAAFAINCLIEQEVDARMLRTARRATARGTISDIQVLSLSGLLGGAGMLVLYHLVNPLTMWLTFATFVGYAIIYTVILKPRTPQNIVIGGLSGAMPPALGWAAVADSVPAEAWVLVLIIFIWTPPHFWALALYRNNDYIKAGLPMLPVTHGQQFTRLHILLYSFALLATTLLPYAIRMSGALYLASALALGGMFVWYAWRLYREYSDALARRLFRFSILYLALLFGALLIDHWVGLLR